VPDHTGRRRRRSNLQSILQSDLPIARFVVLFVAVVAIIRLLTLPEPEHAAVGGGQPGAPPLAVVPTWSGPAPVNSAGKLADGGTYEPRIYLTAQDSVGVSQTTDGSFWRVLVRSAARVVEVRRVPAADLPQFDGFTVSGDTIVWAESLSKAADAGTTVWRTNWRTGAKATLVTSNTGEANFFGREYDLVIDAGRVSWVAVGAGEQTEVRSVALGGGQVTIQRLQGQYALSAFPWAVSLAGGRGTPVELVNLSGNQRVKVATNAAEIATCSPQWCRMAVIGNNALIRIDLQKPDGSQRRRIAGNEATPTITDVAMLDRFVPLKTDRGEAAPVADVGLSLYDITTDRTDLVATGVANVQAHAGLLWWSTGAGDDLVWHAIDLRTAA
jgi:hypothetical protein